MQSLNEENKLNWIGLKSLIEKVKSLHGKIAISWQRPDKASTLGNILPVFYNENIKPGKTKTNFSSSALRVHVSRISIFLFHIMALDVIFMKPFSVSFQTAKKFLLTKTPKKATRNISKIIGIFLINLVNFVAEWTSREVLKCDIEIFEIFINIDNIIVYFI